ncbi:hypothetical protein GX51_01138 [Blastomyces parvus]|uniref:Uncharacterized protein n=1 Tax=Blastomyces parvus TaxID=2060905 RepID=A0A2B7XJ19_9EURO|nr:hypothetical protein GX51_01138 [Blastomyces parvus]
MTCTRWQGAGSREVSPGISWYVLWPADWQQKPPERGRMAAPRVVLSRHPGSRLMRTHRDDIRLLLRRAGSAWDLGPRQPWAVFAVSDRASDVATCRGAVETSRCWVRPRKPAQNSKPAHSSPPTTNNDTEPNSSTAGSSTDFR